MEYDRMNASQADHMSVDETAFNTNLDRVKGERDSNSDDEQTGGSLHPWRTEMARWLLTLNPGRTQDEYAKAVRYFFETPGVPQNLDEITADLLLAYRGALAMRAERGYTRRSRGSSTTPGSARLERLWGRVSFTRAMPGNGANDKPPASHRAGPLAPATVNIRLTALRQFLRFTTLRQPIAGLTSERIQMALQRLPIERRRPYQILSEEEWPAFLAAARLPMDRAESSTEDPASNEAAGSDKSPWGRTRMQRQRGLLENAQRQAQVAQGDKNEDGDASVGIGARRANDGRTGARTAQRDYALVALALATGLRAIELSLLDVGDVAHERRHGHDEWWLTLPDEKTKGQRGGRTLPLAPELVSMLLEYIHSTGRSLNSEHDRATPLFLALNRGPHSHEENLSSTVAESDHPRRLRPEQIRGVINRIETQWLAIQRESSDSSYQGAEARRISPHALRHSAAIALLKGNEDAGRPPASVEHVRGWLGHFDIRTTQRYLNHLNSRDERRKFAIAPTSFLSNSSQADAAGGDEAEANELEE
jgi:integrase